MAGPVREIMHSPVAGGAGLYDRDFYSWCLSQGAALRRRDAGAIDWENVIEEIESLGREQRNRWTGLAGRVIEHMLKIEHWPGAGETTLRKWMREIRTWRDQIARTIRGNPGLQGQYGEMLEAAWHDGRRDALHSLVDADGGGEGPARAKIAERAWENGLPEACPWHIDDIVGYDTRRPPRHWPGRTPKPDATVWPSSVARRLNQVLGTDYIESRPRGPRSRGLSR